MEHKTLDPLPGTNKSVTWTKKENSTPKTIIPNFLFESCISNIASEKSSKSSNLKNAQKNIEITQQLKEKRNQITKSKN